MPRNRHNALTGAVAETERGLETNAIRPQAWVTLPSTEPPRHAVLPGVSRRQRRAAARTLAKRYAAQAKADAAVAATAATEAEA